VRAHGAERTLRTEHEGLLVEWARAGKQALRAEVLLEAAQGLVGYGGAFALLFSYAARGQDPAAALPGYGDELALRLRRWPRQRSETLRVLELLGAPAEAAGPAAPAVVAPAPTAARGVAIAFEKVSIAAGGHTILHDIDLRIAAGEHAAVVGTSGAGKSSLAAVLLGWHRPVAGSVPIDRAPLDAVVLARLRAHTAWLDPAVQIWVSVLSAPICDPRRGRRRMVGCQTGHVRIGACADMTPRSYADWSGAGG
jgi:ATP-binding cassette subfamily B protein